MMWAVPRSRSTAFLRMMIERGDFLCLHEPFCALRDLGSVELANARGEICRLNELNAVIDHILALADEKRVFVKETTDHDYEDAFGSGLFAEHVRTTFMIREPVRTVASHLRKSPGATISDIGYRSLTKIGQHLIARGNDFLVIDSDELVRDPASTIRAYCEFSAIPFDPASLNWAPGHRREWQRAQHWHDEVAETAGFQQQATTYPPFDGDLEEKRKELSQLAERDFDLLTQWRSKTVGQASE